MQQKWYALRTFLLKVPGLGLVCRFLVHRWTRSVAAWTVALVSVAVASWLMYSCYDQPDRPERTQGYTFIDFAGQWIMGRMLARGEGAFLYSSEHIREALDEAYPPNPRRTDAAQDADSIYGWLEHSETYPEISGPLYPPIEAFYTYPLGLLKPFPAYRIAQAINLLLTFAVGFLVWMLTRGRIWAAVGVAAAVAWPGYYGALALAQNPLLTLTLLMLGWLLVSRNHPWLGGFVWGFLAFKPVWAAAFLLAPLLSGRWRVCVAMLLTAAGLVLLTLPFVGWRPWFDWLEIGRIASADYAMSENWIFLSRDLQGLPRRWLSFSDGNATNAGDPLINIIGWGLWLMVLAATIGVALWRRRQPAGTDGPAIAFLMLGAFWSCYHFMYYDVLTAMLPICLLCAEPGRFFRSASAARPGHGSWPWNIAVVATIALFLILPHVADSLELMTGKAHNLIHTPPIDALCLLALWALCGWRWLRQRNAVGANGAVSSKPTSIVAGPGADVLQVAAGADESQPIATDNIRIAKSEA